MSYYLVFLLKDDILVVILILDGRHNFNINGLQKDYKVVPDNFKDMLNHSFGDILFTNVSNLSEKDLDHKQPICQILEERYVLKSI